MKKMMEVKRVQTHKSGEFLRAIKPEDGSSAKLLKL